MDRHCDAGHRRASQFWFVFRRRAISARSQPPCFVFAGPAWHGKPELHHIGVSGRPMRASAVSTDNDSDFAVHQ
jgi:hypothetical protein